MIYFNLCVRIVAADSKFIQYAYCLFLFLHTAPLRLNGGTKASGLVEVYHTGEWNMVCADSITLQETDVICRQLG